MRPNPACSMLLAAFAATGCVSKGTYDRAVAQTETTRAELGRKATALDQANADLEKRRTEIADLEKRLDELQKQSSLEGEQISDMQKRLVELRRARAAAEMRAFVFHVLAKRLEREIDAGDLAIVLRDQRMVLQVPNDILFDSGKTDLKPTGKATLEAVATALASLPNRHFQVAGHTDDEPIKKSGYASNWELSSARALQVVHFLIKQGVAPGALSAAGYGEVDPISSNATPEGRKHNRRTEITIQPSIDDMVHVP